LFLFDRSEEALGDIAFGASTDHTVIAWIVAQLLVEVGDATLEAFKHLSRFSLDVLKLPIGHLGKIGHINLAVIGQGQKRGALTRAAGRIGSKALGSVRGYGTGGTTSTGEP
tara:strand:- start:575 stop:910 length:336 start_codon:yes stop_codon:yes gene_type:complete